MPSLKIESKKLESIIIPSIEKSIFSINSALDFINNASIPNECNISLINSKNDIESVKENLNELKSWCSLSILQYKNIEEKYIGETIFLPNNTIPLRKNKINE